MKLKLTVDLKKLVKDMRGPKGVSALTEEYQRISSEIKKVKAQVEPKAKAQLKKAEAKYNTLVKKLKTAQKDLDKEVNQQINLVKKHAKDAEKNLDQYKKIAVKAYKDVKRTATKKKATPAKRTSKKAASTAHA